MRSVDEKIILLRERSLELSLHCGSSPRMADVAFTSIAADIQPVLDAPGRLSAYTLRILGAEPDEYPDDSERARGFALRETPSGVLIVFIVTVRMGADSERFLREHLERALHAFRGRLAKKKLWIPLMGTGAGMLRPESSLTATLETLFAADLPSLEGPVEARIDLPRDIGIRQEVRLREHARVVVARLWPTTMTQAAATQESPQRPFPSGSHLVIEQTAAPQRLHSTREQRLGELLAALFDDQELRRWVYFSFGEDVHRALPGAPVAFAELVFQTVLLARRHGLVSTRLFEDLSRQRPGQHDRIREVARAWLGEEAAPGAVESAGDPGPSVPNYSSDEQRLLAEQLQRAQARKHALEQRSKDTGAVVREILHLKREIRRGGRLEPGDLIRDGRYLLLDVLGRGGFATVWRALDQHDGQEVAIKVLHGELAGDIILRERFFRGARIMTTLDHPAVVRIIAPHGEDDGFHYFVMELVGGGDLSHFVRERRLEQERVLSLLLQVCEALAHAHAHGIVHRDVKPTNILLTATGDPRLTDFDLVAALDTTGGTRTSALGSFLYAAPEMLERPQEADARVDVYGLAMTGAFLLHGADLPKRVLRDPEGFIAELACPEAFKRILQRAVALEPEARPADAGVLRELLLAHMHPTPRIAPSSDTLHMPDKQASFGRDSTPGESFVEPDTGIRFIWVPGGKFIMGSPRSLKRSQPPHEVELSPFWLAQTPVTRGQYERFVRDTGYARPELWNDPRFAHPDQPVVGANWWDAVAFCEWLRHVSGHMIALPTEAQWEFAARGSQSRVYPWGNEEPDELRAHFGKDWRASAPLPVGSLPGGSGPFGHLDMVGNVWEWCRDVWNESAYAQHGASTRDPLTTEGRDMSLRVVRGGSFTSAAGSLRATHRSDWVADIGAQGLGFRVAVLSAHMLKAQTPHV